MSLKYVTENGGNMARAVKTGKCFSGDVIVHRGMKWLVTNDRGSDYVSVVDINTGCMIKLPVPNFVVTLMDPK